MTTFFLIKLAELHSRTVVTANFRRSSAYKIIFVSLNWTFYIGSATRITRILVYVGFFLSTLSTKSRNTTYYTMNVAAERSRGNALSGAVFMNPDARAECRASSGPCVSSFPQAGKSKPAYSFHLFISFILLVHNSLRKSFTSPEHKKIQSKNIRKLYTKRIICRLDKERWTS